MYPVRASGTVNYFLVPVERAVRLAGNDKLVGTVQVRECPEENVKAFVFPDQSEEQEGFLPRIDAKAGAGLFPGNPLSEMSVDRVEQGQAVRPRTEPPEIVRNLVAEADVSAFTGLGAPYWNPYARGAVFGLTRGSDRKYLVRGASKNFGSWGITLWSTETTLQLFLRRLAMNPREGANHDIQ